MYKLLAVLYTIDLIICVIIKDYTASLGWFCALLMVLNLIIEKDKKQL